MFFLLGCEQALEFLGECRSHTLKDLAALGFVVSSSLKQEQQSLIGCTRKRVRGRAAKRKTFHYRRIFQLQSLEPAAPNFARERYVGFRRTMLPNGSFGCLPVGERTGHPAESFGRAFGRHLLNQFRKDFDGSRPLFGDLPSFTKEGDRRGILEGFHCFA
ncbi:MAG: hypothetical protein JO340_13175 [Acidobacteriaceae bacterium]|nr:hypothetical protein [Acidobacteriaceae bacterium]